ncbi:MAG: protoporphyrinogen oxidase [Nocardioidaceae bacterium]
MRGTVIVGGGISGLATAHLLRRELGRAAPIRVLEAAPEVGGKVRTRTLAGLPVDTGPDAFLSRSPTLRDLVADLGLAADVVEPMSGTSFVWTRGRLRPLPPGMAFGLPERLVPLLRSGLLSPAATVRAAGDLVLPRTRVPEDPTVAELVRPRFGRGVYDQLVAPLLGGVHAGDAARLSARSAVPEVASLAESGRSTYLALRRRQRTLPRPSGRPTAPLVSVEGGLSRLTDALAARAEVDTGVAVRRVERLGGDGFRVVTDRGELDADRVVLATPAFVTADLVDALAPDAALALREIPYVSVANATLAFGRADVPALPDGTGFLVPPAEGRFLVGCTWLSRKWRHLADHDVVLVKCMVGRDGDDRWVSMSDDELVTAVRAELEEALGIAAAPRESLVQRWPAAMPQYVVGHADRLARLDAALAPHPGLAVTGAAYRGVGLAGCVTQAAATARALAAR